MLYILRQLFQPIIAAFTALLMTFSAGSTATELAPEEYTQVKNVIYLIGDGMGPLHLEKAKQERGIELTMDTFEIKGKSMTSSATAIVTDSAAGATALSTGVRTSNGALGVYWFDLTHFESQPKSLTEVCIEKGMMTGIVTTDKTSGATPGGFSVHTSDRDNTEDIDTQQMNSDIDLIWGGTSEYIYEDVLTQNGFDLVKTYDDMMAVEEGERSFAQFDNPTWCTEQYDAQTPTLSQMAEKAIDVLDDTDEGFFIMIEGAHIDKHSHNNDDAGMTEALEEFDETVAYALEYAKQDGETLVVVTADHETGGIVLNDDGTYSFTQGSHSATNVPLLVYGSENFIQNGDTVKNTDIAKRIAYSLGFTDADFPFEVLESWVAGIDTSWMNK